MANTNGTTDDSIESKLKAICDRQGIGGIALWPIYGDKWLGELLDTQLDPIPGGVVWSEKDTVGEVLERLIRMAATYEAERG